MFKTSKLPKLVCLFVSFLFICTMMVPAQADAAFKFKKQVGDKELAVKFFGFSQLLAGAGDGLASGPDDDGLRFYADRIRLGTKYYYGNMVGKLFLDFNKPHDVERAGLPRMIKDAFVGYRWCDAAFIRLGMIKTPLGMDFTTPGWNMETAERNGLEKRLVLERDMGVLLSGRYIGMGQEEGSTDGTEMGHEHSAKGFGYDIGVFNPAERSGAVNNNSNDVVGDALAYVGRIHFDYGDPLHFEAAYGVSEEAGGVAGSEDYEVFDVGVNSHLGQLNIALEYIQGMNIGGTKDRDQSTYVGTLAYMLNTNFELVAKHYQANSDPAVGEETDLGNTYLGVNWYLYDLGKEIWEIDRSTKRKLQSNRLQFNYVFASGDDDIWNGVSGYKDDAYLVQWQYKF